MQFCFIRDDTALVMPVTPVGYEYLVGKKMETVNISALGDVFRPGGRSRFQSTLTFLLPAQEYPFMEAGAVADPQYYLDKLYAWAADEHPVRLVITETQINLQVYIEDVTVREQDSSGDRYVDVAVREYVELTAAAVADPEAMARGISRAADSALTQEESCTIQSGETLSILCRRYYGNSGARYYNALASYNGIKNPHLIQAGKTIRIPPETVLFGGAT